MFFFSHYLVCSSILPRISMFVAMDLWDHMAMWYLLCYFMLLKTFNLFLIRIKIPTKREFPSLEKYFESKHNECSSSGISNEIKWHIQYIFTYI